ncbi:hypothetical protein [Williamsoniiplasma luminosum]|uniref:Uncharacterized protein n=1 Tax=Williamsoniiplasma luminosum TaxID=214888 RepID=A0A2S0NJF3_9MOLU|nr:hypothetical protein [Williamsoniiplasma luminosum]AVP49153.1 MAG: hypothetical protein C5T88_00960 [Williamsoniiplasma luminosum]
MIDVKILALIIIGGIWLATLIFVGFLAFFYSKKHTPLIAERKKYFQDFENMKAEFDFKQIKPININWQLPKGEKILFLESDIDMNISTKKNKQFKNMEKYDYQADFLDDYYDNESFLPLKSAYKLFLKSNANQSKGNIFVSNKRIIIQREGQANLEIALSDVLKAYISMIPNQKTLFKGVILHTKKSVYDFLLIDPIIVLIINNLIKGDKNE